jgi:hypothetical protein
VPASNVAVLDDFDVVDAVVADNVVVTMQPDEAVRRQPICCRARPPSSSAAC